MSEILKETLNSEGVPLLVYKNFKYIKCRCNIGGEIFWRCVNRKCRSYMTTEGQPQKRFIVDSDLNHNHNSIDEKIKPPDSVPSVPPKRKHDDGEVEPRKILAARTESLLRSSSMSREKRGVFKSWSFARWKNDASDTSSLTSSDDGSKIDPDGVPNSDPPFPETYLRPTSCSNLIGNNDGPSDHCDPPKTEGADGRELRSGVEFARANNEVRDEFDVAGWMYGNHLRSLDPQQRFITEKLVADIVFKARLKMLKITSRVE